MKEKRRQRGLMAGLLIAAILCGNTLAVPTFAETVQGMLDFSGRTGYASDSDMEEEDATVSDATESDATSSNATSKWGLLNEGYYQLEAENTGDEGYATWINANPNGDGDRAELQNGGSVTYHMDKVQDFEAGDYILSSNLNGNSTRIKVSVNGAGVGTFTKDSTGWGLSDCREYHFDTLISIPVDGTVTITEADNAYAHLDWIRLRPATYDIEAEDTTVTTLENGAQVHGDGDRVELNGGNSILFQLSNKANFQSGVYELYVGANGGRSSLDVQVDGAKVGELPTPGEGKWERGTCEDCGFGTELELQADSTIRLADNSGSWGHVDYIRLRWLGDLKKDPEGYYQLEAENTGDNGYATWIDANPNGDGKRAELQQGGSVTYHMDKVPDFAAGEYVLSANMNGSSKRIRVSVNGTEVGTFTKDGTDWGLSDCREYHFDMLISVPADGTVTITEADNSYTHLDWIRLRPTTYDIEAEDTTVASLENNAKLHGDGDRVELNSGDSILFKLSDKADFESGVYELYVGANGARSSLDVQVDGNKVGEVSTPGAGKWERGTCEDCSFETNVELKSDSTLRLADNSGSWGHVDYIRLKKVGDLKNKFDYTDPTTGIRIVAEEGILADGTVLKIDSVRASDKTTLRNLFYEEEQKTYFYKFHLETAKGKEIDLSELIGEVTAYLPVPVGYSENSILYYAESGDDLPTSEKGVSMEYGKMKFTLAAYGIYMVVDANVWQLEAENYYDKTTDGGKAADLQPGETIDFVLPKKDDGFRKDLYNLFIRACGYQSYTIKVNGKEVSALEKDDSSWGEYGMYTVGGAVSLIGGDTVSIVANDNYGWVDYIRMVPCKPFEETTPDTNVTASADAGVVPSGAEFTAEEVDETELEIIAEQFGYTLDEAPLMRFFNMRLTLDGEKVQPAGKMTIAIPIPEEFDRTAMSLYRITETGEKSRIDFKIAEAGAKSRFVNRLVASEYYAVFETDTLDTIGMINQPFGINNYYWAKNYYDRFAGSQNQFADLQPEEAIEIPVSSNAAFVEGNYILSLRSNGNRTRFMVKINGVPVGMMERGNTGFEETDMNVAEFKKILSLKTGDVLSIYAPGTADLGPFGWVDYVKLAETDKQTAPKADEKSKITLQAEDYWPEEDKAADKKVANINNPAKKLEIPILEADGLVENDYLFTMYTTGTMRTWKVSVNGSEVLSGERAGSGYEMKYVTKEVGSSRIHLKPGDILSIQFPEQDSDNYGNWVDRIVLNSRRLPWDSSLPERMGGRILTEALNGQKKNNGPATSSEGGRLIYQGEAYYKAQTDNPAADLQPGEQILIQVADNHSFVDGSYRLSVRSCGNRESFIVRVNGEKVGSISRKQTGYGMDAMTDDIMGTELNLVKGDTLVLEGQQGGKYGWVDYLTLIPVQKSAESSNKVSYTWQGEKYYQKQKDSPAADLQPGDELTIPVSDQDGFTEGNYYIVVFSNGDRTSMQIKKNGVLLGSVARNKSNFTMAGITMDRLMRPIHVKADDQISICAPAEKEAGKGPWGWVDKVVLLQADEAAPKAEEEYRYPAYAYGTASSFLAADDLQPGESLTIPLSDHESFMNGSYRIMVLSNGTRERFDIAINGRSVGSISRSASDYSDGGMTRDVLNGTYQLKTSDVITVTGQTGDFYGWVNSLVLIPVE